MTKAIYAGTFDPVTFGHLDIIRRSCKLVDELVVGVLINYRKSPVFSIDERVELIRREIADLPNVRAESFDGLLVDFARKEQATFIIRGLRAVTDFESELQMAQTNRVIAPEIDTIFMTASLEYAYLSSSTVREVALFQGDISHFVPERVANAVWEKMKEKGR